MSYTSLDHLKRRFAKINTWTNEDVARLQKVKEKVRKGGREFEKEFYAAVLKNGTEYVRLRRVTTVKKLIGDDEPLVQWAANQAVEWFAQHIEEGKPYSRAELDNIFEDARNNWRRTRDEAAKWGDHAHKVIENFLKWGHWPTEQQFAQMPKPVVNSLTAWSNWWKTRQLKRERVEFYVYNMPLGFGGTVDLLARDKDGKLWLIDWKTSKKIYGDVIFQVAAYFGACRNLGIPVERVAVVNIGKFDARTIVWEPTAKEIEEGWKCFRYLCHMYGFVKKIDRDVYKHWCDETARLDAWEKDQEKKLEAV